MTQTSKEYAQALFEIARGDGGAEAAASALDLVEAQLREQPAYLATLASPAISREERARSLELVFGDSVPKTVLALLRMMVFRGHARQIEAMIREYRALLRDARRESVARVASAVPLTEAERDALKRRLENIFGRTITLDCVVDPALIGGIRVEAEGRVMDGSIRNRLDQIKEVMDS